MGWGPGLDLSSGFTWKLVYGRDPIKQIYGCSSLRKSETLLKAWLAGARQGPGSRSLGPALVTSGDSQGLAAALAPEVLIRLKSRPVTAANFLLLPLSGELMGPTHGGICGDRDGCGDGDG